MRTTNFDAVVASAPLNRQASIVRDGDGEAAWEPRLANRWWDAPPECQPLPHGPENLAGIKLGRLTVVSHFAKENGNRKWLVRCQCGGYETRQTKAIKQPGQNRDHEAMCCKCAQLIKAQLTAKAALMGKWPNGDPFNHVGLRTAAGDVRLKDRP